MFIEIMEDFLKFLKNRSFYFLFFIAAVFIIIFTVYLNIGNATDRFFANLKTGYFVNDDLQKLFRNPPKFPKLPPRPGCHPKEVFCCGEFYRTLRHPFVVLLLYKTAGRFIGMGSIIDKRTVLTAKRVVQISLHDPPTLTVLAGRMIPWWGANSRVREAREIHVNDVGLALVVLKQELNYYINIMPIPLATSPGIGPYKDFRNHWGSRWAVFGIPRKSWHRPGDQADKASNYVLEMESAVKDKDVGRCQSAYPDVEFNSSLMFCTYANASYSWGCLGSPTVTSRDGKIQQVAVLIASTSAQVEEYHLHVKVAHFEHWIKSRSALADSK